jgi:hypothetical protein
MTFSDLDLSDDDYDEPRPRHAKRCSECGERGAHRQGCPETPGPIDTEEAPCA